MLATLVDMPFDRKGWFFEIKWDGYRAIAKVGRRKGEAPPAVKIYSRNLLSFNEKFPPIVEALRALPRSAVLDGEIVAHKDGAPDFHALQNWEENCLPLSYVVFDLLSLDGKDLRSLPLRERKSLLKKFLPKHPALLYSEHVEGNGLRFFESIVKKNIEGMVAKDAESPYREGYRGGEWLKVKKWNEQEAIIIGFTEPRGSRKYLGALVLGAYENGTLRYIGHSGGGFTGKEIKEIYERLIKIRTAAAPVKEKVSVNAPITWVKPRYVCQVKFSEWTPDGRMRHPIYAGLRLDKAPKEVTRESPIAMPDQKNQDKNAPKLTNLDKIFWPKEKYTKGDVIAYYEKMADTILPYLKGRPESLHRHPNGIKGESFFQKDIRQAVPPFVATKEIWSESNKKKIHYLLCENKATLLYLANLGCIELNPWNSRIQALEKPDYMIIDLDPADNTFEQVIEVAKVVHQVLIDACEEHYIKTSGKTGLHVLVPLGAKYTYDEIKEFVKLLAQVVHQRIPDITSIERSPVKRKKKIYIDYLQNRKGQTIAAPYSLRPWPGATVSTPLLWSEVKRGLDPSAFTIETIWKRLDKVGDLMQPLLTSVIDLRESIRCLERHLEK